MVESRRPDLPGHVDARHLRRRHRLRRPPQRRAHGEGLRGRRRRRDPDRGPGVSRSAAGTRRAGAWCRSSDMVRKIEVAAASRASPDFLIVARTDARTNHGLDEALRRGEAYAKAGADILFIESPESEEEMARIGRHFDVPLLANMADGGRTPILSRERLEELGYRIAIFPGDRLPCDRQGPRARLRRAQGDGLERHAGFGALLVRQVLPPDRLRARVGVREALAGGVKRRRASARAASSSRTKGSPAFDCRPLRHG